MEHATDFAGQTVRGEKQASGPRNAAGAEERSYSKGNHDDSEENRYHQAPGTLRFRIERSVKSYGFEDGRDAESEKKHANYLIPNHSRGLDDVRDYVFCKFLRGRSCVFCELLRFPKIHCSFMLTHRTTVSVARAEMDVNLKVRLRKGLYFWTKDLRS